MQSTPQQPLRRAKTGRKSILRSVLVLLVGTVALFAFIMIQGDVRRRQLAMSQADWHAARLTERLGGAGALPLNLEPVYDPQRKGQMFRVEHLSRQDAAVLRNTTGAVIAAQTVPLPRFFAPDGRAVIFFEAGKFYVKWLTLPEFDRLYAAQKDAILRRSAGTP